MPYTHLSDAAAETLRQMRDQLRGTRGTGGTNTGRSFSFDPPQRSPRRYVGSSAPLPTPQYQGMFYGGVAANQAGFMFIEALGDLPT